MNIRLLSLILLSLSAVPGFAQKMMRDPTRPANKEVAQEVTDEEGKLLLSTEQGDPATQQPGFPSPRISAIIVTEDVKYAIINNEVVYEGQQWRNVLLSSIKPYSITLSINDQTKEITINNNDFITESDENF